MGTLLQDLKYGVRMLGKSPGFTAVAIVTLALGIGANTTIFSWINATLLNPIPGVTETGNLVFLTSGGTADSPGLFSYLDYADLRERNRSFSRLAALTAYPMNLTGSGKPEHLWGTLASANYFDALHVKPIIGRGFGPGEEQKPGGSPVVVISYRLWQSRFGGDRSVVGRTIGINQHPYTVIGVAPPFFQGTLTGLRTDLWAPLTMQQQLIRDEDFLHARGAHWLAPLGRLRPGISRQQAQEEMNLLMQRIVRQYPDAHRGRNDISLHPLWRAPGANQYLYIFLPMLMALAGVVLLLACANVANLVLVRSVARRREMAVRLAVGASRWRVVRQLLVESLLLALSGGCLAILITTWTAGTLTGFIAHLNLPFSLDFPVDLRVLLAALAISILTGVIFGILPALRASSLAPVAVLKEETGSASGGPRKGRLVSGLVVAQVSLSLLLLISAGLFIRAFRNAQRFDPGFSPDHVLLASFDLGPSGYSKARCIEFDRQLLAKLEGLPGVRSVTLANWLPLGFWPVFITIQPEGYVPRPHESMDVRRAIVGPNYLRTMQIPLVAGRDLTPQDTEMSEPAAVVNQTLAERYWPRQDALGKRIHADGQWFEIVGVARNSNYGSLNESPQPFLYLPVLQDYFPRTIIHARVSGDPLAFASAVEKSVHELNPDLAVFGWGTLASQVESASLTQRIAGTFVGAFGLLALVLAVVGIYGVVAYTARQRQHEIAIRLALGAERGDVFRLVLGQGLRLTLAGVALGLAASFALTRFLRGELVGVTPTDPLTFTVVSLVLAGAALAACYLPAWRATKVDPMEALRYE